MQSVKSVSPVATATSFQPREPLTEEEIEGIVLAVKSAFLKLKNLYGKITPVFDEYGFRAPSAGVVARDLSEKISTAERRSGRTRMRGRLIGERR